jgi:hypothetical protein
MKRLPGGWHTSGRPHGSRARPRARVSRLHVSFRLIAVLGLAAALLCAAIAVDLGALPLSVQTTKEPRAATRVTSQPSVAPSSFAPTAASFSPLASRSPVAAPTQSPATSPAIRLPVRRTAVPAASPSSPVLVPMPTAEYQTPRGTNELAWSEAILRAFGAPLTTANIVSMGYWMQNEAGSPPYGIVGANNPINISQPGYGGTPIQNEGGGYFLYSYLTVKDGIDAIVAYLRRPNYAGIVTALKEGSGLSSPSLALEFSVYSGGHYSSVPDAWGASQGVPET